MTREEKRCIEEQYKQDFINKFRNTALESYAGDIYDWYSTTKLPLLDMVWLAKDKVSVEDAVRHCHELITILADLRRSEVHWRDMEITDLPISPEVEKILQNYLLSYIRQAQHTAGTTTSSDPLIVEAIKLKWTSALEWMPLTASFEYDEDGRFTQETFDDAYERIEKCYKEAQSLFLVSNGLLMREFLKFVRDLGVPMNNKTYLQVYRCLEHFGWLPPETAKSHQTTPAKYVKENYIKSRFLHLKDGDFDWNEFITDPIDLDFFDPRK